MRKPLEMCFIFIFVGLGCSMYFAWLWQNLFFFMRSLKSLLGLASVWTIHLPVCTSLCPQLHPGNVKSVELKVQMTIEYPYYTYKFIKGLCIHHAIEVASQHAEHRRFCLMWTWLLFSWATHLNVEYARTRGLKGRISCTWVQCATFLTDRPGRPFLFTDSHEKHELGRGRCDLASCQVSLNSVQRFQRRSRKCLSPSEARAAILFFPIGPKNTNSIEDISDLALILSSFAEFRLNSGFWGVVENVSAIRDQGGHLVFPIDPKNTNLVEDVEILLPVKFRWKFRSAVAEEKSKMFLPIRGQGGYLVFYDWPKNTNLVEDVEILLSVKFCWIRFSRFKGEVENIPFLLALGNERTCVTCKILWRTERFSKIYTRPVRVLSLTNVNKKVYFILYIHATATNNL